MPAEPSIGTPASSRRHLTVRISYWRISRTRPCTRPTPLESNLPTHSYTHTISRMSGEEPFADTPGPASTNDGHVEPQPTEADVVGALADIERASAPPPEPPLPQAQSAPGWSRHRLLYSFLVIYCLAGAGIFLSSKWKF